MWAKKVIKAGWKLLMMMWDNRNNHLHKPDKILEMEGRKELNKSIIAEWKLGLGDLPHFEFSHYFRIKQDKLMKKPVEGKKDWLANIKMARALHEDRCRRYDEFDTNKALRHWIGLPNKDEEMRLQFLING